uniref:Uncharacterized protein n=1 Tax=Pseudomonas phage HRDY3 TaxID=3236930 RepID=A0AB39CEQ9_9VIRU
MSLETLRNVIFGGIVFLAVTLLILFGIYMRNEYAAMKRRQAEEEKQIAEHEAELKAHLHHKPEDEKP